VRIAAVHSGSHGCNRLKKAVQHLVDHAGTRLGKQDSGSDGIPRRAKPSENPMLHYALIFFVVALIAAVLGFGGIAGAAAGIAKILFFVFLVLFVVSLVMGRRPRV
jgi:uncharacterized membrane protein YtjA (UPF0391 family)